MLLPFPASSLLLLTSVVALPPATLDWIDAAGFLQNSGWNSSVLRTPYARLPLAAKSGEWCDPLCPVRDIVWGEGQNGAGLFLAVKSDSQSIWLNATLLHDAVEATNCAATCGSGMDMYAYDDAAKTWRWVDTTTNSFGGGWNFSGSLITRAMVTDAPVRNGMVRYRIYLPIYNGLESAAIGVEAGKHLLPDIPTSSEAPPILFYGTSIVNGHVASRPGMIFTNVLSRRLNRSVINLGFGGNGEMEASIGRLIAEMKQVALIVIDCNWNMDGPQIAVRAVSLVNQLRSEWSSSKPIVLAEGSDAGAAWINPKIHATQVARRSALASAYANLTAARVPNVHYVKGEDLIGQSGTTDLPTAMGTHPTDFGHHMIAEYYAKHLPSILAGTALPTAPQQIVASRATEALRLPHANAKTELFGENGAACGTMPIVWTTAQSKLTIGGRADWGGLQRENFYDRFPLAAQANVTSGGGGRSIWGLSKCSAGEYVGFALQGNVTSLWVNYSVHDDTGVNPSGGRLSIMPPLGRNGVDLYGQVKANGRWVWAGNSAGSGKADEPYICGPLTALTTDGTEQKVNTAPLDASAVTRFILYLPLWRACSDDLTIGIPAEDYEKGGRIVPEAEGIDVTKAPIVWYGTSIVHGAAVSRAGEGFTNRVSRSLNRTVLNFGFSGSGHMDVGIGIWLAKIDAAMFIIDCNWNMQPEEISKKTAPLVRLLRDAHPTTPIILAEGTPDGGLWFEKSDSKQQQNNAALRAAYEQLKPSDRYLHYVESASLYAPTSSNYENPTVGGCHPSDLGAANVATFYAQYLPTLLAHDVIV